VERDNLEEITREAAIKGQQQLKGADFAITGDVAEFGRKEVGDVQLFGILAAVRDRGSGAAPRALLPQVRSAVGAPGA
jgi:curli biogenesis system outer membrane secretion channel CsgG